MLNDGIGLKKCIWNVDLQVCAEELIILAESPLSVQLLFGIDS